MKKTNEIPRGVHSKYYLNVVFAKIFKEYYTGKSITAVKRTLYISNIGEILAGNIKCSNSNFDKLLDVNGLKMLPTDKWGFQIINKKSKGD